MLTWQTVVYSDWISRIADWSKQLQQGPITLSITPLLELKSMLHVCSTAPQGTDCDAVSSLKRHLWTIEMRHFSTERFCYNSAVVRVHHRTISSIGTWQLRKSATTSSLHTHLAESAKLARTSIGLQVRAPSAAAAEWVAVRIRYRLNQCQMQNVHAFSGPFEDDDLAAGVPAIIVSISINMLMRNRLTKRAVCLVLMKGSKVVGLASSERTHLVTWQPAHFLFHAKACFQLVPCCPAVIGRPWPLIFFTIDNHDKETRMSINCTNTTHFALPVSLNETDLSIVVLHMLFSFRFNLRYCAMLSY